MYTNISFHRKKICVPFNLTSSLLQAWEAPGSELNRGWFLRDSCWLCLRCCSWGFRPDKCARRSRAKIFQPIACPTDDPTDPPPLLSNFQPTRPDPGETLSSWMKRAYVWISFSLCTPRIDFWIGIPGHELHGEVNSKGSKSFFATKIVWNRVRKRREEHKGKFRIKISKGLFKRGEIKWIWKVAKFIWHRK